MRVWPGQPYPLGASFDGTGCNFALFSESADRVELCLFAEDGTEERIDLPECTAYVWHGYVPVVAAGQRYGYRVHGPWDPDHGWRANPNKLLLDPYAKAVDGEVQWSEALFSHRWSDPRQRNDDDSAPNMPKSVVTNPWFDWDNDRHPRTPWHETLVYEVHVKGATQLHPHIPADVRGTYAGLAHPQMVEHLLHLGVTAVELMPVHQFVHDQHLVEHGLRNYWGYNSIGYFAAHNGYSSGGSLGQQVTEFKQMVKSLHSNGIEVILDVVYNHTAEGNHLGPCLSFKGIDNPAYYRLMAGDELHYMDYTGTGNTLNVRNPHVLQLIMDSLRYWVTEMHVDGFRFDLAATLARELHDVDRLSAFFDLIQQDPVVRQAKLIAEPWDVGEGGYQVGNFPPLWSEWNGKYRDWSRDYWRGENRTLDDLGYRLTGSSDLYEWSGRRPLASVNFVIAHDGFTLQDLVSYNAKHNEANLENNQDGTDDSRSWNCGAEGETDDLDILALRERQKRNFIATLFLSQGVPMLCGGDELSRTQLGNNNAYCQDNEISWFDWVKAEQDFPLLDFTVKASELRRRHPVFRRRRYFLGRPVHGQQPEDDLPDIAWFAPDGREMTDDDWNSGSAKSIAVFLNGDAIPDPDLRGEKVVDSSFVIFMNAWDGTLAFVVPDKVGGEQWDVVLSTAAPLQEPGEVTVKTGATLDVDGRALTVLRRLF